MYWLKVLLLVSYYSSVICSTQASAIWHLNAKVNRLHRQTNMLQQDIDHIWNVLSDAAINSRYEGANQTNLDDSSTNEMIQLINASVIADIKGLKLEVEQLVNYARKGFRSEKAYNRDAMVKLTNSQNKLHSITTKEIADLNILLQMQRQLINELTVKVEDGNKEQQQIMHNLTQDYKNKLAENKGEIQMQRQLINELTVKIEEGNKEQQHIIHNLTQDYKNKLEENKAEIQACKDQITSVGQALEGVKQESEGNKKMISSVKKRINEKLLEVAACDDGWKSFLDHCYFFSSEAMTWDRAMEFCQNKNSSLLEIDTNEEIRFILASAGAENFLWVGANDRAEEGQFIWQSSKRPVQQHLWYNNEPNNSGGGEDCAEFYKHDKYRKGKLNDSSCSKSSAFVCESKKIIF